MKQALLLLVTHSEELETSTPISFGTSSNYIQATQLHVRADGAMG